MAANLEILLENENYLVINKPAGINVERLLHAPASVEAMVENYLLRKGVKKPFAGIVHRLDRPVTGALLVARKKSILKSLNEQFRLKKITKEYHARVCPGPEADKGILRHWLVKDQKGKRSWAYNEPVPGAQEASLSFEKVDSSGGDMLLKVIPAGGRFHQIRVQLARAGWPIVGDAKYGSEKPFLADAIALHASLLAFEDPDSGNKIVVSAPFHF